MNRELSLVYSVGLAFGALFGGGYWLDQKFHTGYVWMTLGGVLGLTYMVWEIYKLLHNDSPQDHDAK